MKKTSLDGAYVHNNRGFTTLQGLFSLETLIFL